ncbi:hypothetical protein LIA77_03611 [Sarocladium implicatum]|nr:hypothetical protein LIA77_03611 [Sarocladium implicatum]
MPLLPVLSIWISLISIGLANLLLRFADHTPVDTWPVPPTVYLSILATASNTLLKSAFRSSSEIFWWRRLLSPSGVSLAELHTLWAAAHDIKSLFKGSSKGHRQLHLRAATLAVLFLAVNGPLLQQCVSVDLAPITTKRFEELSVRREPMWNLTTKAETKAGDKQDSEPIMIPGSFYSEELEDIVTELDQHTPLRLAQPACEEAATCSGDVVIAGFVRDCKERRESIRGITSIGASLKAFGLGCYAFGWNITGNETVQFTYDDDPKHLPDYRCGLMESFYQFDLTWDSFSRWWRDWDWDLRHSLPWHDKDLTPFTFEYTTLIRDDHKRDSVLVTRCDFSTAFIEVPIQITNGSTVTIEPAHRRKDDLRSELIPRASGSTDNQDFFMHGIMETMRDRHKGYIFISHDQGEEEFLGLLPRKFVNRSSLESENRQRFADGPGETTGYTFSILNPLENFTDTLLELSLRYALATIPDDPDRVREEEAYARFMEKKSGDLRVKAASRLKTKRSKTQEIWLEEIKTIAIYRANYTYTIVALGFSLAASTLTILLLPRSPQLGRNFSMSPLEIAKAFDAPLLGNAGSNETGDDISKRESSSVKVRYGELLRPIMLAAPSESAGSGVMASRMITKKDSTETFESVSQRKEPREIDSGEVFVEEDAPMGPKLVIAEVGQVVAPRDGQRYS